jgi:DNA-binding CsgD family transcriptional regulator
MKTMSTVLNKEERDILILGLVHADGQYLSNADIARRLGMSLSKVKTILHQAFVKLGAHNRNEAIFIALRRGEISIDEFYSLDEMAAILSLVDPDMLRKIAHLVRQGLEQGQLPGEEERIICTNRRQDTKLTKRERDVLIIASGGLTNKEIAHRLGISIGAVRTYLHNACTKLGARRRADAVVLALQQREITLGEITSLNELVQLLAPLGAESIEKIIQLVNQKCGQEHAPAAGSYYQLELAIK